MNLCVTILAGGLGKRMQSSLPKVLHLWKGKPMLVHVIEQSLFLNPSTILIVTGKFNDLIQETVSKYVSSTKLQFVMQETPLGTGHAVQCCLPYIKKEDDVLILNGDTPNIQQKLLTNFISINKNALITCTFDDPEGYGRIVVNRENQIEKIVEEKDASEEEKGIQQVNSGIYKINGEDLLELIPKIDNHNKQNEYYLTTIIELLNKHKRQICAHLISKEDNAYVKGVNTKEQLEYLEKM